MKIEITKQLVTEVVRFIEIDGISVELEPFMGVLFIINQLNVEAGEIAFIEDELITIMLFKANVICQVEQGFVPSITFNEFYNDIQEKVKKLNWRDSQ